MYVEATEDGRGGSGVSQSSNEMAEALPLHPKQKGYKQHVNWQPLLTEVEGGAPSARVARRYEGCGERQLQRRFRDWVKAKATGDEKGRLVAEGVISGKRYSHSALTYEQEREVAEPVEKKKAAGKLVTRTELVRAAAATWSTAHPHPTRHTPIQGLPTIHHWASPQTTHELNSPQDQEAASQNTAADGRPH